MKKISYRRGKAETKEISGSIVGHRLLLLQSKEHRGAFQSTTLPTATSFPSRATRRTWYVSSGSCGS